MNNELQDDCGIWNLHDIGHVISHLYTKCCFRFAELKPLQTGNQSSMIRNMKDLEKLLSIEDPVKRKASFIALLSREIVRRGGEMPIIVGGQAVEIYTQGSYTTGDIDIKAPLELIGPILTEWGFSKVGRVWMNKNLDIYIDWLGSSLDEGEEAERRTSIVKVSDQLDIRVVSIEDLVIDRLEAFKWWGDADSLTWAKVLIQVKNSIDKIDEVYLMERGRKAGLSEVIESILLSGE